MSSRWVFFDLDGTLTRSEEGIWNCARYAAQRMGFPQPDGETLKQWIGPPLIWSFRNLLGMTEKQAVRAQEIYRERYTAVGKFENQVYPGVRGMLRALRAGGVHLGVVTGKPEGPTRDILEHFGLMKFVERISCATDARAEKDHLIRSVLPEDAEEAWMVGDRRFDMEGGVQAGVRTIGAAWGYGTEEELRDAGAQYIARDAWAVAEIVCPGARRPEGAFLSMEGLDGSGKSTQMEMLTRNLERFGFEVEHSREPGGTPIGEKIRELLLSRENGEMTDVTACPGKNPAGGGRGQGSAVRPFSGFLRGLSGRRTAAGRGPGAGAERRGGGGYAADGDDLSGPGSPHQSGAAQRRQ